MNKHVLFGALVLGFAVLLGSCRSDIDLPNLDKSAEVELGIALPLGSVSATIGDFLGNGQVDGIYVGDNGVFFFRDTFDISRTFHDVDLKSKVTNVDKNFDVYEELDRQGKLDPDGTVNETGKQIKMEFPFTMKLNKINSDIYDERLDSAFIENASFSSFITRKDLPLPAEWIDKVEIELGEEFKRKEGQIVPVCGPNAFRYSDSIPVTVDNFTINLMKKTGNLPWREYPTNVKNECQMQINFYFTIPSGKKVVIPTTASYNYSLRVRFIDFTAIWGFFKPSSDMRDADTIVIEDEWPKWHDLQKARLPFYEPRINLHIKSKIAGAMVLHGEYLYVKSSQTGDSIFATFDEAEQKLFRVEAFNHPGEYLSLDSKPGDSIRYSVLFDRDPLRGHIDNLFALRPDILGYKFFIDFDSLTTPQIRVLPKTNMKIEADMFAPFRFNKGLEASYIDTLSDINISKYSLDSLLADVDVVDTIKTANVKLVLTFENKLPVRVRAHVRFLDENGAEIMDPVDKTKPLRLSETDTLLIEARKEVFAQGITSPGEPGRSIFTVNVDKDHYETFTSIRQMEYYAELDAEQMEPYFDQDPEYKVQLTKDDNLKAVLGLSAKADAIFDLNSKEENNK